MQESCYIRVLDSMATTALEGLAWPFSKFPLGPPTYCTMGTCKLQYVCVGLHMYRVRN